MNKFKFKAGDKVRCVRLGILEGELNDNCTRVGIRVGDVLTVQDMPVSDRVVVCDYFHHPDHFEKVSVDHPATWLDSLSSSERKEVAIARGLFAYFPDALALVARHSVRSNERHNPGEPVHWSREKSSDHEDCIARHSISVANDPDSMDGDAPHIVCRAWRSLAALQLWIEEKYAKGEKI